MNTPNKLTLLRVIFPFSGLLLAAPIAALVLAELHSGVRVILLPSVPVSLRDVLLGTRIFFATIFPF